MDKLNFYTVDLRYVNFLKNVEQEKRGFSRVPNMDYGAQRKPKFLCGVVLQVNSMNYYVPVTYKSRQWSSGQLPALQLYVSCAGSVDFCADHR